MKSLIALSLGLVATLPVLALAAATEYELLAPIDGLGTTVTTATYLPGMFRIEIGVAGILAVLAIAYGGIRYMTSDVVTSKSGAIDTIKNALLGLLLALAAFLILETIDPQLTGNQALQNLTNLSAPTNPTPGGGARTPIGYRVLSSNAEYSFTYQEYECEINWKRLGDTVASRERYGTETSCETARADKQTWLTNLDGETVGLVGKRTVEAYVNFATTPGYGVTFTSNTGTYTKILPQTISREDLASCNSARQSIVNANSYRNVVIVGPTGTVGCAITPVGTEQTDNFTLAANGNSDTAARAACAEFLKNNPNRFYNEACAPYYE